MKIVIKDNWAKNLGDVAIAESMISQMREVYPGCEIVLESSHPEITREYFTDIKVVGRLFDISKIKYSKKIYSYSFISHNLPFIFGVLHAFVSSCFFVIFNQKKSRYEILNEIKSADLVLSAGGDFLSEKYAYQLRLFEYSLIKKLQKPLILYAQSIGPFPKISITLVRRTLNKVDGIFARDEKTVSLLKEYGVEKNVYRTADSVILLPSNSSDRAARVINEYNISNRTIMFVVRDTKFTDISDADHQNYVSGIVDTISYVSKLGYNVVFLAPNEEDLHLSQKINSDYNLSLPILDTRSLLPSEVKFILSQIKLLISARMHPMIIASCAGTPVISTGHEFKMKNYMKLIGMEDYYLDMAPLNKSSLVSKIDTVLNNYKENKDLLQKKVDEITLMSGKNLEYLKDLFTLDKVKLVNPLVSVIIVNWNGKKWLKKCLDSLLAQTYKNYEIIFVDNASSDDSVQYVKTKYPTVTIVETGSNLGFAGGNNRGIDVAKGELILLLNNDTWIKNNFLEEIYKNYIQSRSDIVGPLESKYTEEIHNKKMAPKIDLLGHPIYLPIYIKPPFYLSGVCVLFSKKLYIETDGLDNNFFMYFEEIDWFWRLHLYKKTIKIIPDLYVYHAGAGSTGAGIKFNSFLWRNQNTLQMLLKNYAWYNLLWVLPLYILQNIFEMIAFVLVGKPMIAYTYVLGWTFNIKNLRRTLKKRNDVQTTRLVGDLEILKLMYKGPGKLYHLYKYLTK